MQNKYVKFLFFFLGFLLIVQFFTRGNQDENRGDDVVLSGKTKSVVGKEVVLNVRNNTDSFIVIPSGCPSNPMQVERYENGEWLSQKASINEALCGEYQDLTVPANESETLSFGPWNADLFKEIGRYRITLNLKLSEKEKTFYHEFSVTKIGALRTFWNVAFYKPIFNTLVFLINTVPGHSLGLAIILLTLFIKIILLGPNQKALKAQKAMQRIQPELEGLKVKYKNDPQRLASETMAVWKKYKVSPASSCLPMLIQFPILIALFYVVKDGLSVNDPNVLYSTFKDFDIATINPNFLGIIDLTKVNVIVLPIIVGGMQFYQMHLSFGKKKDKALTTQSGPNPAATMQKTMKYVLPIMIAVFTASLPAAVGFYWGTSTLFGIGQTNR